MKVLLLNKDCNMGGVETLMIALAKLIKSYGHECEIFFIKHGPMEKYLPPDCTTHFGDLADCMKLVKTNRYDVVHASSTDWQIGASVVRGVGTKLVLTAHGWVVPGWTSANCDAFTTCSAWLAEAQQEYTDLPIQVVLNGVDTEKFRPAAAPQASSPPIVAWVGRGTSLEHKRIDKLAAVAPALHRAGFRIWLAEPYGPDEVEKVDPEAARILRPLADFWGQVPVEEMPAFFQKVAASGGCVLSTSSYEGLPMTLIEAQGCGCPVIGPDVRGVNECVDAAHGGTLYPFEMKAGELADLIIKTLSDADRMAWRREACVRYVKDNFTLQRMAREYLRIYEECPYASRGIYFTGAPRRLKLSPFVSWPKYKENRWIPGRLQYETSQILAERGEWDLASIAARSSLVTSPTIYVRAQRIAHLLRTHLRKTPATPQK